ncbi:hypothetical protein D3C80_1958750 [compost metagenome]
MTGRFTHAQKGTALVYCPQTVTGFPFNFQERPIGKNGGIIDQHIDAAEGRKRCIEQDTHIRFTGHIDFYRQCPPASRLD